MKKGLTLYLLLLLMFICIHDAKAFEQEISYQGISWGCDSEQLRDHLGKTLPETAGYFRGFLYSGDHIYVTNGLEGIWFAYDDYAPQIAGYDVERTVYAFFTSDTRKWVASRDTKLYTIQHNLRVKNAEKALDDLVNKLSSIYGDCCTWEGLYYWPGANETAVGVQKAGSQGIELLYGKVQHYDDDPKHYIDKTPAPPSEAEPDNLEGL